MFLFLAGASMDGIFNNCGVEVKCPSSLMNADLNKLTEKQLKKHFCEKKNGKMVLKRGHKFYVQVQTQMFVSGFKSTYFVVQTKKGITIEEIPYREEFIMKKVAEATKLYKSVFIELYLDNKFGYGLDI